MTATTAQAQEVHAAIRQLLATLAGALAAWFLGSLPSTLMAAQSGGAADAAFIGA